MLDTIYRHARARVAGLAATLSDDQLHSPVPATPQWTAHELLAHLVGCASDAANARVDGAPGEEWTERHVAERRHRSVGGLLLEWDRVGPAAESTLSEDQIFGPNMAADLICHEADLHEAMGLSRVDREHWQSFLEVMMLHLRNQLRDSPTVLIRDENGQQWICGSGEPTTLLRADGYEPLRAAYSRRSQRQIAEWDWTPSAHEQVIERIGFFGRRDDDQPIPHA
ncbi:maleylpyruvate isomerase family mycothiol-dependent enzyme [Mycolicibacterium palauense]|uniref:maleylpyruvate isomerase family mycothiol-dependent enzyme n=1 Tax=Mycolicibacterium palauense TaxID=2034511 RepID=UPI000BFEF779|nr:maleylpyruvate isomerase family mycothiol-dependent enzyme [Mycolicibacterium palauense]